MITLYSKQDCPNCILMKSEFERTNTPYTEIMIGRDITREEFMEQFPQVRSVPFVVNDE